MRGEEGGVGRPTGSRGRLRALGACVLLAAIGGGPVSAQEAVAATKQSASGLGGGVEQAVNLALRDAALGEVLAALAGIAGVELEYSDEVLPRLDAPVTVRLDGAPWHRVLAEVLRLHRLAVEPGSEASVFRVRALAPAEVDRTGLALTGAPQTEPIALDLVDADLHRVLEGFATLVDAELEADPEVEGEVTLELGAAAWSTALDAVCQSRGCRWRLVEEGRRVLAVEAATPLDATGAVRLEVENAAAQEVVEGLLRSAGLGLVMGAALSARVSLVLDRVAWDTALDAVCQAAGCRWRVLPDPPRVEVTATSPDGSRLPIDSLDQRVDLDLAGASADEVMAAMAQIVGAELELPAGSIEETVTVSWSERTVRGALDDLCRRLGLEWRYEVEAVGSRLVVQPSRLPR